MRTILALCAITLLAGGYFVWQSLQQPRHFGEFTGAPEVAVSDIIARPKDFVGKTVTLRGDVREQCKSMGCYFFVPSSKGGLRIELKDVAMYAPMHEGRPMRVEGQIVPYSDGYQLWANAVEFQ